MSRFREIAEKYFKQVERKYGSVELRKPIERGNLVEFNAELKDGRLIMRLPQPTSLKNLFIFLHECHHALEGHPGMDWLHSSKEYNADAWALNTMEAEGLTIPPYLMKMAQWHIAGAVAQDLRQGKRPDRMAIEFATPFLSPKVARQLGVAA